MPVTLVQRKRGFSKTGHAIIGDLQGIAQSKLLHIVDTDNRVGFRFRHAQRRKEEARENGNNRDHDKELDDREG